MSRTPTRRTSLRLACLVLCGLALTAHADAPGKKSKARTRHKPAVAAQAEPSGAAHPTRQAKTNKTKRDAHGARADTEAVAPEPTPAGNGPAAATAGGPAPATAAKSDAPTSLPQGHTPRLELQVEPANGVKIGQVVHVEISAAVPLGDDVTVADQTFSPFEVYEKRARVEPPSGDQQRFVFNLDLLALEAGDAPIPAITLRVVTKDNSIGSVTTEPRPYKVQSLIANEPNAQPKQESAPVAVLEDNYLPIYVLGGLAAAALIAVLTLLLSRYLQRRKARAVPPPPPKPPWDIAVEALTQLRRKKQSMLDSGQGAVFVDQLSDVVRAYLGGRYAFDGLETTTDEMIAQLKARGASLGFTQEVGQFLGRCDLVKFAKVEPDADEVDLLFAKAQDLVQLSEPERLKQSAPNDPAHVGALQPTPPRRSQRPDDGGPAV